MCRLTRVATAATLLVALPAAAQDSGAAKQDTVPEQFRSGVYLTAADFTARRLANEIDCRVAKHKIDRHTFLNRPYVDVRHGDEKMRHAKADIFGYRGCDTTDVRFAEGREFRVLATAPLVLYEARWSEMRGKAVAQMVVRRFSVSPDAPLRPVTRDELKRAFPENHRLHHLLDDMVRSDQELMVYDALHREYRVARLLAESQSGL